MASSTPLRLAALIELADQHYNLSVLTMMQNDILFQAIEELTLARKRAPGIDELLGHAQDLLPKGLNLQQMYFQQFARMASAPIEELESTADTLSNCARHLEAVAARALARPASMLEMESARQVIGNRLAQLIEGARALESRGVISVSHYERLETLTARPSGPLAAFYDKALAIAEQSGRQHQQKRMAA